MCRLCLVVPSTVVWKKSISASSLNSSGCSLVGSLFPVQSRKRLACDVLDPCATHASLVDVTSADCSGHKMTALTVMVFPLSVVDFNTQEQKLSKTAVCLFFVPFQLTVPLMLHFRSLLTNAQQQNYTVV